MTGAEGGSPVSVRTMTAAFPLPAVGAAVLEALTVVSDAGPATTKGVALWISRNVVGLTVDRRAVVTTLGELVGSGEVVEIAAAGGGPRRWQLGELRRAS